MRLYEILTSDILDSKEKGAVRAVYDFLEKSPSTVVRVSEFVCEESLLSVFSHHSSYVNYAIDVLEKNGIIECNALGIYSVR